MVTDDPDGLFVRATAAGGKVLRELHDTDYGSRDFAVLDPEGNHWSFGTYRGEPRGKLGGLDHRHQAAVPVRLDPGTAPAAQADLEHVRQQVTDATEPDPHAAVGSDFG